MLKLADDTSFIEKEQRLEGNSQNGCDDQNTAGGKRFFVCSGTWKL